MSFSKRWHTVDGRNPAPPGMYKTFVYGIFTLSAGRGFLPSTVLFVFRLFYVQSYFGSFCTRHPSTARLLGDLKLFPDDSQDEMRGLKISVPFSRIKKVFYSMIFCWSFFDVLFLMTFCRHIVHVFHDCLAPTEMLYIDRCHSSHHADDVLQTLYVYTCVELC